MNKRLFFQLLAAAINLRTYMDAIERDRRIVAGPQGVTESEAVKFPQPPVSGLGEDWIGQLFEGLLSDGGDHA